MESVGVSTAKVLSPLAVSLPLYSLSLLRVFNVNFERKRIKMNTLSHKQKLALLFLLANSTRKEAASGARISRTTLWRYEQKPEFQAAYQKKIAKIVQPLILQILRLRFKAIIKASELLDSKSAEVQLKPIDIIFAHSYPGYSKKK
jgi:hypothetical protein